MNLADALHFLADCYLKSSIHRVVAPPPDRARIDRLGVIYMVRIEDDTDLVPLQDSTLLCRLGLVEAKILGSDGQPVKVGELVRQRIVKNIGAMSSAEGDNEEVDVEIVKGVKIKYYDSRIFGGDESNFVSVYDVCISQTAIESSCILDDRH